MGAQLTDLTKIDARGAKMNFFNVWLFLLSSKFEKLSWSKKSWSCSENWTHRNILKHTVFCYISIVTILYHFKKPYIYFKGMWLLNKCSDHHEILHAKIADQDLFKTFFRIWFESLEAEICRFFMLQLTWDTL